MMKKKNENIWGKVFFVAAIGSTFVALLQGLFYYDVESYPNPLFRGMLILQNCIKAFEFKADISLKDIAKIVYDSQDFLEIAVAYAYAIALFVAPYCTLVLVYKVIERIFKISVWRFWPSSARRIIIFGYNDAVKALIKKESAEKRRIHLVSANVSQDEEWSLIKKRVILHKVDFLGLDEKQILYFSKQIELIKAKDIILFEDSSAKNFSLYNMFHTINEKNELFDADVKFFCRCEDDSIERIIEDYYDTRIREKKAEKDPIKKEEIKVFKDLEIVNIPELRIRSMLKEHPLHNYHIKKGTKEFKDWNLHLLIVGFGKIGQQLLLQAMNQGVVSSENSILIDVVDFDIDKKKSIFANCFDNEYIQMKDDCFIIDSKNYGGADGKFKIRFNKMDIRYKQFYELLLNNSKEENGGEYTYITICISDSDVSLHCMSEIERYLRNTKTENEVSLGIRMETDRQMASYLNENTKTYNNVFVIEDKENTISMDDLLMDKLDEDAKNFNFIYNNISIVTNEEYKKIENNKETNRSYWTELELFRRDSNRAIASHQIMKEELFKKIKEEDLEKAIGVNGTLLKKQGDVWIIPDSMDEFVSKLCDDAEYAWLEELAKLEHRRWCYFMASRGWKRTENPLDKKNDIRKENPCMCTWEELRKYVPDTCRYDLMPLLMKYKK